MTQALHAADRWYDRERVRFAVIVAAIILAIVAAVSVFTSIPAEAEEAVPENTSETVIYEDMEFSNVGEYHKLLNDMGEEAKTFYPDFIEKYGDVATDDEKVYAASLCALMSAPASIYFYKQDEKEFNALKQECEKKKIAAQAVVSYASSGGTSYAMPAGNGVLTRSNGTVHFNGHRETWYSIHESGQTVTAYNIPGKHIGDDGIIRDKDGYICVASKNHGAGTVIETSRGTGKVYDKCGTDAIDLYTAW